MIKADVLITNKNWKKFIGHPNLYINKKLKKIDKKINLFKDNNYNFTLLLSGTLEIKRLNTKFRKKNKATDILSFPFYEKKTLMKLMNKKRSKIYLGDIIINLNELKRRIKKKIFTSFLMKFGFMDLFIYLGIATNLILIFQ